MTMPDTTTAAALSDHAWAEAVAAKMGLTGEQDVDRVERTLRAVGVTVGRPPAGQHQLTVEALYFSGIKVVRDDEAEAVGVGQPGPGHSTTTAPFAFHHRFTKSFTVFATDGENSTGKSTILGVILWGLRGAAPNLTLQADVRDTWLREVVLVVRIDLQRIVVAWQVDAGRPVGAVYVAHEEAAIDVKALYEAAVARAALEQDQDEGVGPAADAGTGIAAPPWPGEQLCRHLLSEGDVGELATFDTAHEFETAVAATLMPRLELQALPVWQRLPGGVDKYDADLENHDWKTIAQAMAIVDPTSRSVLGENVYTTGLLLSLFLGSRWAVPTMVTRAQKGRADQTVAGQRRRRDADTAARRRGDDQLEADLAESHKALAALPTAHDYRDVLAATERANADAVAAARSFAHYQRRQSALQTANADLEAAEQDLGALSEAMATRRFWHSLRPSCCPRCDTTIDDDMWARERDGRCSLCSTTFSLSPAPPVPEPSTPSTESDGPDEDEDDEESALRLQIHRLREVASQATEAAQSADQDHQRLRAAAEQSAAELSDLDRGSSAERYELELQIARLEARIEERAQLEPGTPSPNDAEFTAAVLKAALDHATKQRDAEQRQALIEVSAIITELGIEFGIRNLVSARLLANGHLPVVKGETTENFGELAPGERLRLRIALVVALLCAGRASGISRHPGLLIIDDLTTHEMDHADASRMAIHLAQMPGIQVITASTYANTLRTAVGDVGAVVGAPEGLDVMF